MFLQCSYFIQYEILKRKKNYKRLYWLNTCKHGLTYLLVLNRIRIWIVVMTWACEWGAMQPMTKQLIFSVFANSCDSTILAKTPMFNNLRPVNVMQPTRPHSHRRRHGLSSTRWLHFAIVQLKFMADSLCLHSANSLNDVNIGIDFYNELSAH